MIPKKKNNIEVYRQNTDVYNTTNRRQELLDSIIQSDVYLPDSILHDDLDLGMLEYVKKNFVVISGGEQIPIHPSILTIQRWSEMSNNFTFSDSDKNVKLPFIAVIRKPDVQPGTKPVMQHTVPDRELFHYATVPTWNGTQSGADVYKIPQPVAIDISYEVIIVCNQIRDLNRLNKIVMQKFSSRQSYTMVKGHYIPIVMDGIDDSSPIESLEKRRFFIQTYRFTMMGFLIDDEEFEVKPAISRLFVLNEFVNDNNVTKKYINKSIDIIIASFNADGMQTAFSVGETIGILFSVSVNGLLVEKNVDYFHIALTSKITFLTPPIDGSVILITYLRGRSGSITDNDGNVINAITQNFTYDGSTLYFTLANIINSVISVHVNGLQQEEGDDYTIEGSNQIKLITIPLIGANVGVTYLF